MAFSRRRTLCETKSSKCGRAEVGTIAAETVRVNMFLDCKSSAEQDPGRICADLGSNARSGWESGTVAKQRGQWKNLWSDSMEVETLSVLIVEWDAAAETLCWLQYTCLYSDRDREREREVMETWEEKTHMEKLEAGGCDRNLLKLPMALIGTSEQSLLH